MARLSPVLAALSLALVAAACSGSSDTGGLTPAGLVVTKASSSGDGQSAAPGAPLPSALSVIVTDNGSAQSGETVTWATTSGTITSTGSTDAAGISTATWTLGSAPGTQTATATVAGATNSPLTFTATAANGAVPTITATSGLVFTPSTVTISPGGAVRFVWASGAGDHNVLPATGNPSSLPASPGFPMLIGPPQNFTVGFPAAGVFNFWCSAHGANPTPTTVTGMSGTITVQ
jgi:plastocyanin